MGLLASIRLPISNVTLSDIIAQLHHYVDQVTRTGAQLRWDYAAAAFPYTMIAPEEGNERWFFIKGQNVLYRLIVFGVREETTSIIEIVLPDGHTHGDKAKANELCKYLLKQWGGTLTLFNGRQIAHETPIR